MAWSRDGNLILSDSRINVNMTEFWMHSQCHRCCKLARNQGCFSVATQKCSANCDWQNNPLINHRDVLFNIHGTQYDISTLRHNMFHYNKLNYWEFCMGNFELQNTSYSLIWYTIIIVIIMFNPCNILDWLLLVTQRNPLEL
jgi:hypothetical protein